MRCFPWLILLALLAAGCAAPSPRVVSPPSFVGDCLDITETQSTSTTLAWAAANPDGVLVFIGPVQGDTPLFMGLCRMARKLDLNTATQDELMALPMVGEARASAIISYRERNRIDSVGELAMIPSIGPATIAAIKPFVEVR